MPPATLDPEQWQRLPAEFVSPQALDKARRLTEVTRTRAGQETLLPDPAAFATMLAAGAAEPDG